jgi:segregation and condensation protein B
MEKQRVKSIIESVLFATEKPLSADRITDLFEGDVSKDLVIEALNEIKASLDLDESKGLTLDYIAEGWQLRTKEENQSWLIKLENIKPIKLSQAVLEVLAIVAYKQPLTKSEIDKIRGVDSSHLVKTLLERGMVKITGRSDLPGKPLLYATTSEFLEIFGINDLRDLPSYAEIEELISRSIGNAGDIKEQQHLDLRLKKVVDEKSELETVELNASEDILDELDGLNKELKINLDLVQEQVDVIFEEACRKYSSQRKQAGITGEVFSDEDQGPQQIQ